MCCLLHSHRCFQWCTFANTVTVSKNRTEILAAILSVLRIETKNETVGSLCFVLRILFSVISVCMLLYFVSLAVCAVIHFSSLNVCFFSSFLFVSLSCFNFVVYSRSFMYTHGRAMLIFMNFVLSLTARTIYSLRPYSLTFNARMRNIRSHWIRIESNERARRMCEWVAQRLFWCVVRLNAYKYTCAAATANHDNDASSSNSNSIGWGATAALVAEAHDNGCAVNSNVRWPTPNTKECTFVCGLYVCIEAQMSVYRRWIARCCCGQVVEWLHQHSLLHHLLLGGLSLSQNSKRFAADKFQF